MIPRHALSLIVAALLVPARAFAGDPPGMPSTGGTAAGASNKGVPSNGAGDGGTDAAAQQRINELKEFVLHHQSKGDFADHEGPNGECKIDTAARRVHLVFRADGVLHCRLGDLAEGYTFDIAILTIKNVYDTGDHYLVTVKPGDRLPAAPVHGNVDDVKTVLGVLEAPATEAGWWTSKDTYGPYHNKDVTITVALQQAGVSEDTKVTIASLYLLNVAVVAIVGPGTTTFSVTDNKIASSSQAADLSYYFGVHIYPFSWNHNGDGNLRPGRYFSSEYQCFADRISILAGANLSHPTQQAYIGLAIEIYDGFSLTAGWQPRKIQELQSGHSIGEATMADSAPTNSKWDLSNWGIGLSIDGSILKPITSLFAK